MDDTPEQITIYHDKEVGMLARRAESLTINEVSINATRTQEIPGQTIVPVTGHVPGADPADNLAVFRAFRPDQPDPPPGIGGGGGGGSGGSGGGGGAPPLGPRGAGHGAPLPPHVDNKLYGQSPDILTGDKQKAREFITQWDFYWSLNFNTAMMRTPYTKAMLFLTFFKRPLTANWTSVMNQHLNTQVQCQEAALTRRVAWRQSRGGVGFGPSGKQLHPATPELTAWRERPADSSQ